MPVRRLIVGCPLLLGACFAYRPVTTVSQPAGTHVNVLVSDAGAVRLAPRIGERVSNVEGVVVASDDSTLTLAISAVRRRGEPTVGWAGERLSLARGDIAVVEERKFSRSRTAWTVAGIGAVVAVVAATVGDNIFGGGDDRGPIVTP